MARQQYEGLSPEVILDDDTKVEVEDRSTVVITSRQGTPIRVPVTELLWLLRESHIDWRG